MNDSNPLHDVLAEVFSAGEPAGGDGPAVVFTRAARIRTRQRITVAATMATVVAIAAVVVGAATLAGNGVEAVGGPGSDSATSTAQPTGPAADFDVFATLTRLLPLDNSTEEIGNPIKSRGFAAVSITDPQGTTRLEVSLELNATALAAPLIDCAARNLPVGTQCNVITQPGGARMLTSDGTDTEGWPGIRQAQVDLLYPDGRRVAISEWNAEAYKGGGPATRPTPLLTIDQLVTIATAPDWWM